MFVMLCVSTLYSLDCDNITGGGLVTVGPGSTRQTNPAKNRVIRFLQKLNLSFDIQPVFYETV